MNTQEIETELGQIYLADQAERTVGWDNIDFETMRKNDEVRLRRAKEIYKLQKSEEINLSKKSLYQLGMLFQHSPDIDDFLVAQELGILSGEMGYSEGAWLSAAAEDRYLFYKAGVQKWGTQFKKNDSGEWEQIVMMTDSDSGVTDDMRAQKKVPPRSRQMDVYLARTDI